MVNRLIKQSFIAMRSLLTSYLSGVIYTLQIGKHLYNSVAHYGVHIAVTKGRYDTIGQTISSYKQDVWM